MHLEFKIQPKTIIKKVAIVYKDPILLNNKSVE